MGGTLEVGAVLGGYRILAVLGRGGMGVVYRAEDLRLGRLVALKVLSPETAADPSFRERFMRESRMLASIEHRNIVAVFHADQADGHSFLAMRLIDGFDLGALLRQRGRLEKAVVSHIVSEIAEALDAAHAHGLVHRDVKPGNILISAGQGQLERAQVYLTDFGLTKRTDAPTELTITGQFLGTVDYVAPEQVQGSDVDGRADLYALACVVYECLAGTPPFHGSHDAAALMAHLVTKPPSLHEVRPDLPGEVSLVLARGMAKNRDQRPATCAEFARELRHALESGGDDAATGRPVVLPPIRAAAVVPPKAARLPDSQALPPAASPVPPSASTGWSGSAAAPAGQRATTIQPRPMVPPYPPRRRGAQQPAQLRRHRSSRFGTVARMLAAATAVIVLGAAGFMAYDNLRQQVGSADASPTSANPGGGTPILDPGSVEQRLRNHIPAAIWPSCLEQAAPEPAIAARSCSAENGQVILSYLLYADDAAMADTYDQVRQERTVEPNTGQQGRRCADPSTWPNEGVWTFRDEPSGRLICSAVDGRPQLSWSDLRTNVLTHAVELAGDGRRLYLFWRDGRFPSSAGSTTNPVPVPPTPAPSPPTPPEPTDPPSAEQLLRRHIPRDLRSSCEAALPEPPELSVQSCTVQAVSIELRYALYDAQERMTEAYERMRQELAVEADSGEQGRRCRASVSWPNEGPYTANDEPAGRVLCMMANGQALMVWTDERVDVLTRAVELNGDRAALHGFWSTRAGPVE